MLHSGKGIGCVFCPKNLSEVAFRSNRLIYLVENIARQISIQDVTWLLITVFSYVSNKNFWSEKMQKMKSFNVHRSTSQDKVAEGADRVFAKKIPTIIKAGAQLRANYAACFGTIGTVH